MTPGALPAPLAVETALTLRASVGARPLGDREHSAVEQLDVLLGALDRVALGALGGFLAAPHGLDRPPGGGLGELAGDQVVAQVALGDVDHGAALAELVDVLQEDRL